MSVESAADRAAFLGLDDWGVAATFTPVGGSVVSLTILFDQPHQLGNIGDIGVNAIAYRATLRADDVASAPRPGDALVVSGLTFKVAQADKDIDGTMWMLELAKQ